MLPFLFKMALRPSSHAFPISRLEWVVSRFSIPHTCLSQLPGLKQSQGLLRSVHLKASQPLLKCPLP
jgi:hypothetical protein